MSLRAAVGILALVFATACARPAPRDRLLIALPSGPLTLLPHASNEEFTNSVLANVYEPLVDLDAGLGLRPGLARAWHTPDDLTWVFELRPHVRWHDGQRLRASQVAESLERARSDPESRRRAEMTAVAAIDAPDDATIRIRTRIPLGPLPNRLTNVPVWTRPGNQGPAQGTGPYRIRNWTPGGDTILEAFDGYDRARPPWREVVFRAVADANERVQLLRAGQVDLVLDAPPEGIAALEGDPRARSAAVKGLRTIFLVMDCARPRTPYVDAGRNPFVDRRVRKALALAVDREALVRGPLRGHAEIVDQIVGPEVSAHRAPARHPHDLAAARALLAEAGWHRGFTADLHFPTGKYRGIDEVAQALADQLAPLGVRLRPRPSAPEAFVSQVERRDTSLYLLGSLNVSGDAGLSYEYLLHTQRDGFGKDNGGGYSKPDVDRLLQEATRLAPSRRWQLLAAVADAVHDDVPVVPLYRQTDLYAVATGLEFTPRIDRRIRAADMAWKAGREDRRY